MRMDSEIDVRLFGMSIYSLVQSLSLRSVLMLYSFISFLEFVLQFDVVFAVHQPVFDCFISVTVVASAILSGPPLEEIVFFLTQFLCQAICTQRTPKEPK